MTLTGFLLARIAEDEAHAYEIHNQLDCDAAFSCVCGYPDRIAAGVERDRRIVAEYARVRALCGGDDPSGYAAACLVSLTTVLRALALPYADHPDCRPEWRP